MPRSRRGFQAFIIRVENIEPRNLKTQELVCIKQLPLSGDCREREREREREGKDSCKVENFINKEREKSKGFNSGWLIERGMDLRDFWETACVLKQKVNSEKLLK